MPARRLALLLVLASATLVPATRVPAGEAVATAAALAAAIRDGAEGSTILVGAGTFELDGPLEPKSGMTIRGAGEDQTILTGAAGWKPSTATLPDPEMKTKGMDTAAYLFRLKDKAANVAISGMTLRGPQLHGALFAWEPTGLHLDHLRIRDVLWSGVRTFGMKDATISDCEFIDAGGRWDHGQPGTKGGITGGGIFAIWMSGCEIANNRFLRTRPDAQGEYYGIKVRQGKRCRVHHNTIETNFSMEFPFENDEDNEIAYNVCHGTISIPKHAGGPVPASGSTFHFHHNRFLHGYALEFVRNGVEIDHNLFDFDVAKADGMNLISGFGSADAQGPASFHDNVVENPGRGVIWINEVFNHLEIRNNRIVARTTPTPRTEGLFGLNPKTDFSTITIRDNIIECIGQPRPLLRCAESYRAVIANNALTNVADADKLKNPMGTAKPGPDVPLTFSCGAHDEVRIVDGKAAPAASR
jgi:nitrous oxidase accessory protein